MPSAVEERIDRLETRVDRIDDKISSDLQRIFQTLEELKIGAAKHACPSPGACITLGGKLEDAIKAHNATMLRVERLELKMLEMDRTTLLEFHKIEKQKAWVLGAWSVVALAASIVGALVVFAANHYMK